MYGLSTTRDTFPPRTFIRTRAPQAFLPSWGPCLQPSGPSRLLHAHLCAAPPSTVRAVKAILLAPLTTAWKGWKLQPAFQLCPHTISAGGSTYGDFCPQRPTSLLIPHFCHHLVVLVISCVCVCVCVCVCLRSSQSLDDLSATGMTGSGIFHMRVYVRVQGFP